MDRGLLHKQMPMLPSVTKAVILVGGYGTRLRPLTYTVPKPLIPFCNKPILKSQIESLVAIGISEIILALNYHSDKIVAEAESYEHEYGISIIYSKEDDPMGTAGPLALVCSRLASCSFFVLNSDICCDVNLESMRQQFLAGDALGLILSYGVTDPTRYGLLCTDGCKVVSFQEKPKVAVGTGPWLINAGIYILSPLVLGMIEPREMSIEKEIFPVLAEKGLLHTVQHQGYWMDIGQPQDYLLGQKLVLMSCETHAEGQDAQKNVVIGRNVQLGRHVKLRNCAIFDCAVIEDNVTIEDSIVGWRCLVRRGASLTGLCVLGEGTVVEEGLQLDGHRSSPCSHVVRKTVSVVQVVRVSPDVGESE